MKITPEQKNKGFTLIELLVVVAIIGLLSSIVLVSVNEARQKSQNTAKNKEVTEYINALELFISDNRAEGYPSNRASNPNNYICLGNQTCQGNLTLDTNNNPNNMDERLRQYIQPSVDNYPVLYLSNDMKGIAYKCLSPLSGSTCNEYSLQWYLNGVDQDCVRGSVPVNIGGVLTKCLYSP